MSFPTTNWTMLAEATIDGDESGKRALEQMCFAYRQPVAAFLASKGYRGADLEDLVQEFFFQWLKSRSWKRAEQARGRFRTFLLGAANHMLAHHHEKVRAHKRGGHALHFSLDQMVDDGFEIHDGFSEPVPEFDREWAITLVSNTLEEIRSDFETRDRTNEFEVLRRFLPGAGGGLTMEDGAARLDMEVGALKAAIHRLRGRFRERLRASVARTVAAPHEVDEELAYLRTLLFEELCNPDRLNRKNHGNESD
jgi:RNA polymerase sigma-70 factor (ECF subfamily)